MDKRNRRNLAIIEMLRNVIALFFSFFLSIYLYQITDGDINFVLGYTAYGAAIGMVLSYVILKIISVKNAKWLFWASFLAQIVAVVMLLVLKENVLPFALVIRTLDRFSSQTYYAVYETALIRSSKKTSLSSYVAGVGILLAITEIVAPAVGGFMITEFSYDLVFAVLVVLTSVAAVMATRVNFTVIDRQFKPREFWRKAIRRPNMRRAYLAMYFRRVSAADGVLKQLMPITLYLAVGTEFSAGSYNSLFSVVFMALLEGVRMMNRRGMRKRFYLPGAILILLSAVVMVINFDVATVLVFYFMVKTVMALVSKEGSGMIYAVGLHEKLGEYTREHIFTFNVFLGMGHLTGAVIAFAVYNYCYSLSAFGALMVAFAAIYVVYAGILQRVERELGGK